MWTVWHFFWKCCLLPLVMVAVWNRADHYIFILWFLSIFFFFFFPRLILAAAHWMSTILPHMVWPCCEFRMQVWKVLHVARWKYRMQKSCHLGTIAQLCRAINSQLRHVSTIGENSLSSSMSSRCAHNMVNFGPLTAEIGSGVWGTSANFNGFRILAALLHGSQVVSVSQTLQHWTEGATYVRQGDHHVGHWPTF